MTESRSNVFISGTSNDLAGYRRIAQDVLLDCQLYPLVQEHFVSETQSLEESIRSMILRADMVICLVGFEFGDAPPDNPDRSWSQLEYDFARKLKKPIYVFFFSTDLRERGSTRDARRDLLQQEYREALTKRHNIRFFDSADGLRVEIAKLVVSLRPRVADPSEGLSPRDLSVIGGSVGGLLSGVLIAALYYLKADRNWAIAAEIVGYTALVGAWASFAIPALKYKVSTWIRRQGLAAKLVHNEVISSGLAGICAAPLIGIFGVLLFAFNPRVMDIQTVFPATALGAVFVSAGVLLPEAKSSVAARVRAILSCALAGVFVLLASTLLDFLNDPISSMFVDTTASSFLGGAILSALVGLEIGLQLGLARLLCRLLESTEAAKAD